MKILPLGLSLIASAALLAAACSSDDATPTVTLTPRTPTSTASASPTGTSTEPTGTATGTETATPTESATETSTATGTATESPTPTSTGTATPTESPTRTPSATPTPPVGPSYDDQSDPVTALASLYDAINRGEFDRAYNYWQDKPAATVEDFAAGYADTASVQLVIGVPVVEDPGAGNVFASIPALLVSTHTDGSQETFAGCYTMHTTNPGIDPSPDAGKWKIRSAEVAPASTRGTGQLESACADYAPAKDPHEYADRKSGVGVVASLFNAINRGAFQDAYGYWEEPPGGQTEQQFEAGYADTKEVDVAVIPPTFTEGAAGSLYASVPTLLIVTKTDGSTEYFAGCYVTRRTNDGISDDPDAVLWRLYQGNVASVPDADATRLLGVCDNP